MVYSIQTAQVGIRLFHVVYKVVYKVYVLFQNVRSVTSVCSGGLGFVVSDTGQCDNCEGGRTEKLCTKKLSCENYSRSRSVL